MRPELSRFIARRYPRTFHTGPSSSYGVWGFEHGDGWAALILALGAVFDARAKATGERPPRATQVKEKFGSLRFYAEGGDAHHHGAINLAEALSGRISERTGKPGRPVDVGGWAGTLADGEEPKARLMPVEDGPTMIAVVGPEGALAALRAAYPDVALEIPAGWTDVAAELLTELGRELTVWTSAADRPLAQIEGEPSSPPRGRKAPGIRPTRLAVLVDGSLEVEVDGEVTDAQSGAITLAQQLARFWVDPVTGAAGPLSDRGVPEWTQRPTAKG